MIELFLELRRRHHSVLTPHGLFRLANPEAVMPGRLHLLRYHIFGQFAQIVAIGCHRCGAN